MLHIRLGLTGDGPAESCGKPPIGSRGRPPTCNTPRTARKEPDRPEAPPAKNPTREGYSGASEWDWWGSWGDPGRGRVQICHKGAPGRDRSRRKPRNINDSSCAPRLDPGLCGRFGHDPAPGRPRSPTSTTQTPQNNLPRLSCFISSKPSLNNLRGVSAARIDAARLVRSTYGAAPTPSMALRGSGLTPTPGPGCGPRPGRRPRWRARTGRTRRSRPAGGQWCRRTLRRRCALRRSPGPPNSRA